MGGCLTRLVNHPTRGVGVSLDWSIIPQEGWVPLGSGGWVDVNHSPGRVVGSVGVSLGWSITPGEPFR